MAANEPRPDSGKRDAESPAAQGGEALPKRPSADSDAASISTEADDALDSVARAADSLREAADDADGVVLDLPNLTGRALAPDDDLPSGMNLLNDVALRVKVELGRTQMFVEDVLRLNGESVIELDKAAGDPVDIYVNDRHVARGEVLVLNENFCVRVSEIVHAGEDG